MNKLLILMVGPPGSGKSTIAKEHLDVYDDMVYVNQDLQGQSGHLDIFLDAIGNGSNIIVDRMNFNKKQRDRYLGPAKKAGYITKIIVLHLPRQVCLDRCLKRKDHPTIKDAKSANNAVHFFFKSYERVDDCEADEIIRHGWKYHGATQCVVCDLDGTMANIDHRLHFVRPPKQAAFDVAGRLEVVSTEETVQAIDAVHKFKANWKEFFNNIPMDSVNEWCDQLVTMMSDRYPIVYATGRPADYHDVTYEWLNKHGLLFPGTKLFMREAGDYRADSIVKQNILDFEIKTRYDILFVVDDRQQVVDMWRDNGYTVLQCAKGDF